MWGKNCLNVGVFLVMVFVLFSCKKDPVDLGFEVNADDPITFVWNDSGGKTFTVTSNSGWYIYMAGQESWCQALISEGKRGHDQVVTLKVNSENSYITEREMELYVRNEEGDILTVKVMQEGNPTSSGAFVIRLTTMMKIKLMINPTTSEYNPVATYGVCPPISGI